MWKGGKIDKEGEREGEGKKERANFMDEICNNFHVFSLSLSLRFRLTWFVVVLIKILSSVT